MVACCAFSMPSLAPSGNSPLCLLQSACASSCFRRSIAACPRVLNEAFIISATARSASESDGRVAQPATQIPESASARIIFGCISPLSLDRRGVERAAFGLLREVRYQRDRRIGSELQFREAHLSDALPHSPLHGP